MSAGPASPISDVGTRLGTVHAPSSGSADVWCARVGEHADDVERYSREFLSRDERERLGRYRSRESAERYVVTRSLARIVLAGRLGATPREVAVSHTGKGKPVVAENLHFNVSHSGDLILLAVSDDRAVGIDVERRRDVERVDALIARWLTPQERADVAVWVARKTGLSDAFLRVWSLKEARLKALGVGIAGAALAPIHAVDALPLDHLLDPIVKSGEQGYVGAVAFA